VKRGKRGDGRTRDVVEDFKRLVFDPYRRARQVNRIPDIMVAHPVEKDGGFVLAHKYWVYFLDGARDFSMDARHRWGNLIDQIFQVTQRADAGDEEAKDNLDAIHRIVFAGPLGVSRTALRDVAEMRGPSMANACAWLLYDLIERIAAVVEPIDPAKVTAIDSVRLREDLLGHPLAQYVGAVFKPGKVNTPKSLARHVLELLLVEARIHPPTSDYVDKQLKRFFEDPRLSAETSTRHIERLRIEGFDYYSTMDRKGFNRAVPEGG
jgi:hypothetical protein